MKYIRSLTQQRLCLMLAVYIGLIISEWRGYCSEEWKQLFEHLTVEMVYLPQLEVFGPFWQPSSCYASLTFWSDVPGKFWPRWWWDFISAAASYYMTFANVVVNYGIVLPSVMTTDIDLSERKVVGKGFIVWTVLACLIPLFFI